MDIKAKLITILNEYKGTKLELTPETTFDSLGFDSLDKVELLMKIEDEFNIQFSEDFKTETFGELVEKIGKLVK